ncbi:MAG: prepilin peptidase [Gammaproteobacteria bacterium]|nr:prepilin peptidase [Gammaproteobacteria bacterium]
MEILFSLSGLAFGLLVIWCLACAFYDIKQRRLPNLLTLGMHIPALVILLLTGQGLLGASVSSSFAAWALALLLTLPAYVFNWLGAGDVKFLAALGLLTGLNFLLTSYVIAGLLAGLIVLVWLTLQRLMPYVNLQLSSFNFQFPAVPLLSGKVLPFGAILTAGALIALFLNPNEPLL